MRPGVRAWGPLVLASVLAALLLALASLQWRWLGQISADERDRMQTSLRTQVTQFTQEFDRELTRAYFWLQADRGATPGVTTAPDSVGHFQRWFSSAPHPGLVRQIYVVSVPHAGHPEASTVEVAAYDREREGLVPARTAPAELSPIIEKLKSLPEPGPDRGPGTLAPPVVADGPALVIPRPPVPIVNAGGTIVFSRDQRPWDYTVVLLDPAYIRDTFLPELLARHFGEARASAYRVSIVDRASKAQVFCTDTVAARCAITSPDASEDFFEVRMREFNRFVVVDDRRGQQARNGQAPASVVARQPGRAGSTGSRSGCGAGPASAPAQAPTMTVNVLRAADGDPRRPDRQPLWRADFAHRAGSLEAVVASTRRRNLLVSFGVLVLLGASIGLLLISTARARRLAAQQMEFVAGVSHELRTPLAVIRSAAENLADGVVADQAAGAALRRADRRRGPPAHRDGRAGDGVCGLRDRPDARRPPVPL